MVAVLLAFYEKIFNYGNTKIEKHEIDLIYFS